MNDMKEALREEFEDKEARKQYAAELLNAQIALQIKTLRQQRKWSQTKLAKQAGKHQSQISEMESVDFSAWKVSTLLQLAEAFDLALSVKFESFGKFLDETSRLGRKDLERPSFAQDPAFHEEVAAAIERAPERIEDPECPYDPNDPKAVEAFWKSATVRRPGQRGR